MSKLNNILYKKIIDRLDEIISASNEPEGSGHAHNTVKWVKEIYPDAGYDLLVAAYAHDIDRASSEKVRLEDYPDLSAFKQAHAQHSAEMVTRVLNQLRIPRDVIARIESYITSHETGGTPEADVLRDADSLSFFEGALTGFAKNHRPDEVKSRCEQIAARLSPRGKTRLQDLLKSQPALLSLLAKLEVAV